MVASSQIRLLLVEDVPQVAQYVRGLLSASQNVKLLEVLTDGRNGVEQATAQRPDVVMIDALLQGRVKGTQLAQAIKQANLPVSVVMITVPQNPMASDPAHGIDAVLSMPFTGYELVNLLQMVVAARMARDPAASSLVASVFAPKGGVGKTTISFNMAVALQQVVGRSTVLVDGSLQFGDLRALLKVPSDAPSILDLPTDRIQESDLTDVLWRDPSGIDILLAPPRIEMAEMVTPRDVDKVLSLLRRVYGIAVIDTPVTLGETTLAFLDASDVILEIITYDSTTIHNAIAVAETFAAIGYPPHKVQYLLNRSDSSGGVDPQALARMLGRIPEHTVVSDGKLVMETNNQGVPFVLYRPDAPISRDVANIAAKVDAMPRAMAARA